MLGFQSDVWTLRESFMWCREHLLFYVLLILLNAVFLEVRSLN